MLDLKVKNETCDILIIGGGVAGLQAAIAAKEASPALDVLVMEKADTRRSGMGATGNDHFFCYLPKYHGNDFEAVLADAGETMEGMFNDPKLFRKLLRCSGEIFDKWENYGIPMRPYGDDVLFEGHTLPGKKMFFAKYDGQNQKKILTKIAKSRGARIENRVTARDILVNPQGIAIGAVGVENIGDLPAIKAYGAKIVIMALGSMTRMYPSSNPAYLFNINECPANAAGASLAWRAGARLVNYDRIGCHAGPRYFERSGKATWIGMVSDIHGKPIGPFVKKPSRKYGDPMADIWPGVFRTMLRDGSGPAYMNCTGLSREDIDYMQHCFITEGLTSVNDYLSQRHIDLKKSMIEFGSYALGPHLGGIDIDEFGQTTINGLYAAGSICGNIHGSIAGASVFGMVAGERAAAACSDLAHPGIEDMDSIRSAKSLCESLLGRKNGAHWKEVNSTLQNIMKDYAGEVRSATLFKAGLAYLRELRSLANEELSASNAHELTRCLEVLDLLDLAEVTMMAGDFRQDNRGINHNRIDYPFANPLLNGLMETVECIDGNVKLSYRMVERG